VLALAAVLLPSQILIFHWLFLFLLGMLSFQLHAHLIPKSWYFGTLILMGAGACYTLGPLIASVGVATALAISWWQIGHPFFVLFGNLSYSLYLIHIPIGMKVVNLGCRLPTGLV